MTKGFWEKLEKPIFALAPLYDVTDAAFRAVIAKYGKPDVFFTEFTSAEGLASAGREKLMQHLWFGENEHPIVAQIFGKTPEAFFKTAQFIETLGFDGIDINFGCPDKNVMKQGSCAALYNNPKLAQEVIRAAQEGAGGLPVSAKIRIGDTKIDWEPWIVTILETQPAAISIHLRTRKEMSLVPAHWELMPDIVKFIHKNTTSDSRPVVLGNGDVKNLDEANQKIRDTGCDGVMIGRGIFGNPWLFNMERKTREGFSSPSSAEGGLPHLSKEFSSSSESSSQNYHAVPDHIPLEERMRVMIEHTEAFEEKFKNIKPFEIMKKHYKAYVTGFDGASELREKLYAAHTASEVKQIVEAHFLAEAL